jgi:1-acyl-sn-glycerol-3-phosphate acyltransferase
MHYTMFNTPVMKSVLRGVALILLKLLGWKADGKLPEEKKYVLIVAPHTSNWDLFYGIILALALKLDARYIAKKELFRGPFSGLMRWSGAIPVDRASSQHVVEQMAFFFGKAKNLFLRWPPKERDDGRIVGSPGFIISRFMPRSRFCWATLITPANAEGRAP